MTPQYSKVGARFIYTSYTTPDTLLSMKQIGIQDVKAILPACGYIEIGTGAFLIKMLF